VKKEDSVKHETSNTAADRPAVTPWPETVGEIMTTDIVSVPVGTSVRDVAILLLAKRISAIPVLAAGQQLVGMVSEGDLPGRNEADRLGRRDWWLAMLRDGQSPEPLDALGTRSVEQVMHSPVLTIEARAPLHEMAEMLRVYDIKRLPVMRGGRMVGIVSRSDLVRAVAIMIPQATSRRSAGGLLSLFAGMMQTDVRAEDTPVLATPSVPPATEPPDVTADAFRALVTASKQAEKDGAIVAKQQARLEQQRRVKAMLAEHLDIKAWTSLLARAHAAATNGEKSFELFRFPCDLCSDGGRKIDVAETDWPTSLRAEAAEIFERWERELRPAGFGLIAQIVEYFDGIPGNIALTLTWTPRG
jgi:CBS domain-containing protein